MKFFTRFTDYCNVFILLEKMEVEAASELISKSLPKWQLSYGDFDQHRLSVWEAKYFQTPQL